MSATTSASFGPSIERFSYQQGLDQPPSTSYDTTCRKGFRTAQCGSSAFASQFRASGASNAGFTKPGIAGFISAQPAASSFGFNKSGGGGFARRDCVRKGLGTLSERFGWWHGARQGSSKPDWGWREVSVRNVEVRCNSFAPRVAGNAEVAAFGKASRRYKVAGHFRQPGVGLNRPDALRYLSNSAGLGRKRRVCETRAATKGEAEAVDLDSLDLDSLDLESPEAADIIRAAKIAQLERMSPEEIRALPRSERLVPKKRRRSRANDAFQHLGDTQKLEKIRKTLSKGGKRGRPKGSVTGGSMHTNKKEDESIAALLESELDDDDVRLNRVRWGRNSIQFGFSAAQFASAQMSKLLKDGLVMMQENVGVLKNEMRARPVAERRKYTVAAHFKAHEGSAQAMIHKVMRMWEEGEFKQDAKAAKQAEDAEPVEDVEYGLSYDVSRLHVPFRTNAQDAFHEMLALQPEERERFFHQGFLDVLKHETATAQLAAFRKVFFNTLIVRAKAVNRYCQTLFDFDGLQIDNSSLDMAVYLTRFSPRNYKNPEDISAIIATVENRLNVLRTHLYITRELAVVLLISYPRYLLPSCNLEKNVEDMLRVLERFEYDNENIVKLVFKNPSLFTLPLQRTADNIRLLQAFGLAEPEYATKLRWLIGSNLMQRLAERVILLRKFGVPDCDIPRCFQRNIFLFLTTTATMSKHLLYLESLGRGSEWVRSLVVARPKVINYSLERQAQRLQESLKKVGVELPHEKLVDLIVVNSPLYATSTKKFDAFLNYLTEDLGLSPHVFLEFPSSVGYSLEGRVKPRVEICRSVGIVIADVGQPGLSLAQVLVTKFPWFKHKIESGIWLRKYGGSAKELEFDETGQWVAAAQDEELEEEDDKAEGGEELPAPEGGD